jgi:hypothetical protein
MERLPTPWQLMPFLPNSWLQSCLRETSEDTGEHHVPCVASLPTPPQDKNTVQPLGGMKAPPSKTENHKQ